MSKQALSRALRNWVDNGVLLGVAATLSVAILQVQPFSSAAAGYVTFWMVLPAVWLTALSSTRVLREFLLACYDDLGTTPRRVVAGGAIGAAFIVYMAIISSNIPEGRTTRQTQTVTSLALIP